MGHARTYIVPLYVDQIGTLPIFGDLQTIVRPVVAVQSTLKDRTPAPAQVPLQTSEKRWGKASTFQYSVTAPLEQHNGLRLDDHGNKDNNQDKAVPQKQTITFNETSRTVKNITIYNPADHEQYVIFQRIEKISFDSPGNLAGAIAGLAAGTISGLTFEYVLHNPEAHS